MITYNVNLDRKDNHYIYKSLFNMSLFLTLIQQLPVVREYADEYIRIFLYLVLGTLFFYTIIHKLEMKIPTFLKIFILTAFSFTSFLILISILGANVAIQNILQLLIPLALLMISYNLNYSKKQLNRLLFTYVLLSVIVGIFTIYYYGEGFKITQVYFLKAKNQIGPIFGMSCLIMLYKIIKDNEKGILSYSFLKTIIKITFSVLLFAVLLVLRNRSGLLALIFITVLMLFTSKKKKINKHAILVGEFSIFIFIILVSTGVVGNILKYIWTSFTLNYDITNLDSISATRTIVYSLSLQFIKQHPIIGSIGYPYPWEGIPHNYFLYYWVNYGIIGSLPIILFYCYLWGFALSKFRRKDDEKLAIYLLLFVLITSMFEYTHPYGPGVTQIMVWFMLGQYLRNTRKNDIQTQDGKQIEKCYI